MARNKSTEVQIPNGIASPNPIASADWYYGAFNSIEDAYNKVPASLREVGRQFAVYKDATKITVDIYKWEKDVGGSWTYSLVGKDYSANLNAKANTDASNIDDHIEDWREKLGIKDVYIGSYIKDIGKITTNHSNVFLAVSTRGKNTVIIDNVEYSKTTADQFTFTPVSTAGNIKYLILYALPTTQIFYLAEGAEGTEVEEPTIPESALFISRITVTTEGQQVDESTLNSYKEKAEDAWKSVFIPATGGWLQFSADKASAFNVTPRNALEGVTTSVYGIYTNVSDSKEFWAGKTFLIRNNSVANLRLNPVTPSNTPLALRIFQFENTLNVTLKPYESAIVKLNQVGTALVVVSKMSGGVQSVVDGLNTTVDNTDASNPIIDVDIPDNPSGSDTSVTFASTGTKPYDMVKHSNGDIYVSNFGSNTITKVTPSGVSSVFATLPAGSNPWYLQFDSQNNLFVSCNGTNKVAKITTDGTVIDFATVGSKPVGLGIDSLDNIYVANNSSNYVSKITPAAVVTTFATTGNQPFGIYVDTNTDNVYVTVRSLNNVSKITPDGILSILGATQTDPFAPIMDSLGNLYVPNHGSSSVTKITPSGAVTHIPALGTQPHGITVDLMDNIYVTNHGTNNIARITPSGIVSIIGNTGLDPFTIIIGSAENEILTVNNGANNITKITLVEPNPILAVNANKKLQRTYIPYYVKGEGITIDRTDPRYPIISTTGEAETLETVMNRDNYAPKPIEFEKTDSPMSLYYKNSNFWISDIYDPGKVTGERNYMIGTYTGENLTTGHRNILIGSNAGNYLTTGARNTFVGSNAGYSIRGNDNTAIGALAGQGNQDGVDAVATTLIGSYAGYTNSGSNNTALGAMALYKNTTGGRNTAIGSYSLYYNDSGRFNTVIGSNAGLDLENNGSFNVFIGENVFSKDTNNVKINGNKNVYIGFNAGGGTNGDNNVFIGAGAGFAPGQKTTQNVNNRLVIHNQISFADAGDMTIPPTINSFDSVNNGLIIGDFYSKWVKFNGKFLINPSYMPDALGSSTYTKKLVYNPTTGDVAMINDTGGSTSPLTEILYADLKTLRDNGGLTPGMQYRITDYVTTTSQQDTQSAGHQFDIIVTADSASILNEDARAALHTGDTYFANAKLESWKLKYCIDNDTSRFLWADATNGKGVIWHMIDDKGNSLFYDFKNIQFKRYKITAVSNSGLSSVYLNTYMGLPGSSNFTIDTQDFIWLYTFNSDYSSDTEDDSLANNYCRENVIRELLINNETLKLNNNTFGNNCNFNTFEDSCNSNTFGDYCIYNTFGNYCSNNTFWDGFTANTFRNNCNSNTFGNGCSNNTFGNNCFSNTFWNNCNTHIFGNNCDSNTLRYNCLSNIFGNYCSSNTIGNACNYNTFGNYCSNNIFGGDGNTGEFFQYNHIENGCSGISDTPKNWTTQTALYGNNKYYSVQIFGYRTSNSVATTNTYQYYDETGTLVKRTW